MNNPARLQVNLTWACSPLENQYLVSGQLHKNTWPCWTPTLSLWCGHGILVSGCLVLTGVNRYNHEEINPWVSFTLLYGFSINLLAFYHEWHPLIDWLTTLRLFCSWEQNSRNGNPGIPKWDWSQTNAPLDYSLLISMRDSWLRLRPHQLSHDRNLELII